MAVYGLFVCRQRGMRQRRTIYRVTHVHPETELMAARLRAALTSADLEAYASLLDEAVRWGPAEETPETCHGRTQVLERLTTQRAAGMQTRLLEVVPGHDGVLVGVNVKWPAQGGFAREQTRYQVLKIRNSQIVDIRGYDSRAEAADAAGMLATADRTLSARQLVPILNVSNFDESVAWFARLGWTKHGDWSAAGGPPTFGAVGSGECEIFLCLNGQGGRGEGQGVWLSIWIDDVDALHAACQAQAIEVVQPPRDEAWGVREMLIRHPDGHVFRMTQAAHQHPH